MKQKNTKELDDILGKTHISDFDKFCVEQKGSMDPEQNAFSEYIKDLLKEKRALRKYEMPQLYAKILRDAFLMLIFKERPGGIIEVNELLSKNGMEMLRTSGVQE